MRTVTWREILMAAAVVFLTLQFILLAFPLDAFSYTVEKRDERVTGESSMTPPRFELDLNPRQTVSRDVKVTNRTGQTLTYNFRVEDFQGSDDPAQSTVFLGNGDGLRGARDWVTPEITSIVLNHGETLTMKVKVAAPGDAAPGGYYAALLANATQETAEGGKESTNNCLFYLRIAGNAAQEGTLNTPEVAGLSSGGPLRIGLVFDNQGDVHLKPSGRIVITNFLGQTVAVVPVAEWLVLPEASRRTLVEWNSGHQFGRFQVTAEIDYGSGGHAVASRSFWVFPWEIVLAFLVGLGVLIAGPVWLVRKRKQKGKEAEEKEQPPAGAAVVVTPPPKEEEAVEELPKEEETEEIAVPSEPPAEEKKPDLVALGELFPSIGDERLIDLGDPETLKLVRTLIDDQLDLARSYMAQGEVDVPREELKEARAAAMRLKLYAEVGVIDDMLRRL